MKKSITIVKQPLVFESDGQVYANSQQVAQHFEKQHNNVLRDIDTLLSSEQTPQHFFHETTYIDGQNGQVYRAYNLTRDGTMLLCMGFTGPKALQFKIDFINAFNDMEATIKQSHIRKSAPTRMSGAVLREIRLATESLPILLNLSTASKHALIASMYEPLGILIEGPKVEKTYSTTEIGRSYGVSASTLGKMVTKAELKNDQNGELRLTTLPNGKQVEQWAWYEHGRQQVQSLIESSIPDVKDMN